MIVFKDDKINIPSHFVIYQHRKMHNALFILLYPIDDNHLEFQNNLKPIECRPIVGKHTNSR